MKKDSKNNIKFMCIIPAAGVSSRFKKGNKLFENIYENEDVLNRTIKNVTGVKFDEVFVGLNSKDINFSKSNLGNTDNVTFFAGGESRQKTVLNGLDCIKKLNIDDIDNIWVLIHDAARPIISSQDISEFMINVLRLNKSCIMAIPVSDTIKKVDKNNNIIKTTSRDEMWLAQTPQMFRFEILYSSLEHCITSKIDVTDESQALEILGHECAVVRGKPHNIKITEDIDLNHAKALAGETGILTYDINKIYKEEGESDD
tara:strand:+ start:55 stop:828 length:774 start_codon:yes stop_codon:yes gene_type:complete